MGLDPDKLNIYLPYYCFLSSYILVLLHDGYRFPMNTSLTVLDQVNGHKVGWALGAILYEINELPWVLKLSTIESYPWGFVIVASVLGFIVGATAAVCIYREFVEEKRGARPPLDYDIERISRTPTVEMMDRSGGGGMSGGGGGGGIGINIGGPTKRPSLSFSPPGSPGQPSAINRKSASSNTATFLSPYNTPAKSSAPPRQGESLLQSMMGGFQRNNVNRYEPVPDK